MNHSDPLPAVQLSNEIKIAAWGGPGGQKWDHKGTIKHIVIVHGLIIDSITLTTVKPDGDAAVATKFGGGGGDTIVQVSPFHLFNQINPSQYSIIT